MKDALDRTTQLDYNKTALRQLTTTALHGSDATKNRVVVDTFDRKLRLLSTKDPLGLTTNYEYDPAGNVEATTDPRQVRSTMRYDTRSNLLSRTNGLRETTTWEYNHVLTGGTPRNKPTKETRPATAEAPEGRENRYEYEGAGNLRFHRDGPKDGPVFGTLAEHL